MSNNKKFHQKDYPKQWSELFFGSSWRGSECAIISPININGNREFTSVIIKDEVLSEDKDIVEDLILVAANQAITDINKKIEDTMSAATGGMLGGSGLPGL